MEKKFNFEDLFIFEMANNHQGDVEHALEIIRAMGKLSQKHQVRAGLKFQFRQIQTMIHPAHQENSKNKHIPRFLSTYLTQEKYQILYNEVRNQKMLTICTPFDEASVDIISQMNFDILKIGSCSATDWPLLEKVADSGLPVIFSTGALTLKQVDDVVSFFEHHGTDFAIMHCVSIYPTSPERCQLNQIDLLKKRYPNKVIGWSTHESPEELSAVQIAVAKGAKMFERHVGIETDKIKLNAYSSTPEFIDKWLQAYEHARKLCGGEQRPALLQEEEQAVKTLLRGIYAKKPIKKGAVITADQVYFAMPYHDGQLSSGEWKKGIISNGDIEVDAPIFANKTEVSKDARYKNLKTAIHEVKGMLNEAGVILNSEFEVEYSHHYGINRFNETGAVIINCINRDYCKKIIVQLAGQSHPSHFHQRKEETFQVLHGTLHVLIDNLERVLKPGETCLIQPGVWHSFWTETGCIFEEISTTHYNNDSYYKEKSINQMQRSARKTTVDHWGRFQLKDMPSKSELLVETPELEII